MLEGEAYVGERALCLLNRAACYLQTRDFKNVVADCSEVLVPTLRVVHLGRSTYHPISGRGD